MDAVGTDPRRNIRLNRLAFWIFQLNANVNYFQRKFVNEVRRCDELERKLRYIETEVRKDGVPIPDNLQEFPRAPNPRAIIDLEVKIVLRFDVVLPSGE